MTLIRDFAQNIKSDGDLVISGEISAPSTVGHDIGRLTLRDDSIEEHTTDSDSTGVAINYYGYDNGDTRFRDLSIYNGKQSLLAKFDGSESSFTVNGSINGSGDATFAGNVTVSGDLIITTTKQPGTYSDNWKTTKYVRAGAGTIGAGNTGNAWVHLFTISNSSSYDKVHFIAKIGAFDDVGKGIEIIEAFYENTNAAQENHTIYWRKGGAGATYLFNEIRSIRSSSSGASNTYDVYAQITANWIDYFTVDFEYWVQSTSGSTVSFPSSDWTASAPSAGSDDRAETARRDYFNNITSDTLSTDNVSISGNGVLTFGDKTFNGYDIVVGNQTTARAMVFAPYSTIGTRYSNWDTWIGQNTRPPIGTQDSGVELASSYIAGGASGLNVEFQQLAFYTWTPSDLTGLAESDPLTSGTPKFLVDVSGNTTITGDLVVADGKGINFNAMTGGGAYSAGTGTSSTLDDYEEGTWTPTLNNWSATGTLTDTGTYRKVGQIVFISLSVNLSSPSYTGSGSGVYITGLPYAPNGNLVVDVGASTLFNTYGYLDNNGSGGNLYFKATRITVNGIASVGFMNSSGYLRFTAVYCTTA